jgi:sugar phosphate isomerase/epimerase
MQIGVTSYSYIKLVRSGAMTQLDVVPKAAEMGFTDIEFSAFVLPEGETPLSFAPKVRKACDEAGLSVTNYTIHADFLAGSGGDLAAEIERTKTEVLVAEILGAPGMRHDATSGYPLDHVGPRGFDNALPRLIEGCRGVTAFAKEKGIKTMVENHGYFCQDSERVEKLINGVADPNFGALLDMGNFICVDEDPAKAVGRMAPYAIHAHAKDFHLRSGCLPNPGRGWNQSRGGNYWRGSIVGQGDVPLLQCLRTLKKIGYDGFLSIEFEGMEDPILGVEISLENLKRLVAEAG